MNVNNSAHHLRMLNNVYNRHGLLNTHLHGKKLEQLTNEKNAFLDRLKNHGVASFFISNNDMNYGRYTHLPGLHVFISHNEFDLLFNDPAKQEIFISKVEGMTQFMQEQNMSSARMTIGIWDGAGNMVYGDMWENAGGYTYYWFYDESGNMVFISAEDYHAQNGGPPAFIHAAGNITNTPNNFHNEAMMENFNAFIAYHASQAKLRAQSIQEAFFVDDKSAVSSYVEDDMSVMLPPGTVHIGTEGHTINRANMRSLTIEHNGGQWQAFVVPDGVWLAQEGWQNLSDFSLLDITQGVSDIPASILNELEALSKMLQHIPPPQFTASGVTLLGGGMFVTQHRSSDDPGGASFSPTEQTPPEIPSNNSSEILQESLQQIANAFVEVYNEVGGASSHYIESAFFHMLRNSRGLAAHLARMNLNGANAADFDADAIRHLQENAQQQINEFGENFLMRFKLYGLDDSFNVAWAMLMNAA